MRQPPTWKRSGIFNPLTPDRMGYYQIFDSRRLALEGNYAYLLSSDYANMHFNCYVRVVDISNPADPTGKGKYTLPSDEGASSIGVRGSFVYVAQPPRLTIIDARNPDALTLASQVTATQGILEVAVRGDYAYLVGGKGLHSFIRSYCRWLACRGRSVDRG